MITIKPEDEWRFSLLLLHGLGADGRDLAGLVPRLKAHLPPEISQHLGVVCPDAPERPISINGGYRMRGWFDIHGLDAQAPTDQDGIAQSVDDCVKQLSALHALPGSPPVIVGGFSQGGVIALHTALGTTEPIAGAVGLSTWLPAVSRLPATATNTNLPVFLAHGVADDIVPTEAMHRAADRLHEMGIQHIDRNEYSMPHAIIPEEIQDLGSWVTRVFQGAF